MLARMNDWKQEPSRDAEDEAARGLPAIDDGAHVSPGESERQDATSGPTPENPEPERPAERDLRWWFIALFVGGTAGLLLGQGELAVLVALAGLFVAAQAADLQTRWKLLYYSLSWIVPVGAVGAFSALAVMIAQRHDTSPLAVAMGGLTIFGAAASGLLVLRPISDPLCRIVFPGEAPNHSLRLTLRLVAAGVLFALPGWFALREMIVEMLKDPATLERSVSGSSVIGMVVLALASVGYRLRRDFRETLARLGIVRPQWTDALWVLGGLAAMFGVTAGLDALQKSLLPALWASDRQMTETIVAKLSTAHVVLLGASAGIGEEITMRGALQPRLGVWVTALLGAIRQRTNTTVVVVIHTLFDITSGLAS
jgi:membrane protease YdiL (CAAX protease family)